MVWCRSFHPEVLRAQPLPVPVWERPFPRSWPHCPLQLQGASVVFSKPPLLVSSVPIGGGGGWVVAGTRSTVSMRGRASRKAKFQQPKLWPPSQPYGAEGPGRPYIHQRFGTPLAVSTFENRSA